MRMCCECPHGVTQPHWSNTLMRAARASAQPDGCKLELARTAPTYLLVLALKKPVNYRN